MVFKTNISQASFPPCMRELPWSIRYAPADPWDVCASPAVINEVLDFVKGFDNKTRKKGLILYGPTGSGKTSLVYAVAHTLGSEVLEINASDSRNKSSLKEILGPAIHQSSLFGGTKIILVDELDGMSGTKDRGGASELASLLKETTFPIVMTAQDPFDSKFSKLRSQARLLEMKKVPFDRITSVLKHIADSEKIGADDDVLGSISRLSNGDLRGAINDLQSSVEDGLLDGSLADGENYRDVTQSIPDVLRIIFKSKDMEVLAGALYNFEGNLDDVFMWLDHNIPDEYKDPVALQEAYEYLSRFDIYNSRIRKRQYWRYLAYMSIFLGCGVGLSKSTTNTKFIKYERSSRPLKIWMSRRKYAKRESISKKIASRTHWSSKEVIKNFGFYRSMARNSETFRKLVDELGLESDEASYLKG